MPTAQLTKHAAARLTDATKLYKTGSTTVHALDGITVDFEAGQFTAIMGPSGSGKSTLMHCIAGLDQLTTGDAYIGDTALSGLSERELTDLRRSKIGFIFQAFNLIPSLTAVENITLPMLLDGRAASPSVLNQVVGVLGLDGRLDHRPSELSGGQQQRVAVARALVSEPEVVFADEPTGNLDSRTGAEILSFMRDAVTERGQTTVMVTHDPTAAAWADRVIFIVDGVFHDEIFNPTADDVLDIMRKLGN